tara:strand:- start:445 stop:1338 length:894 start_codon:yes stop_codon:yes gene_type:complete
MDKKSIPTFFVLGVQKSATSFIHSLLYQDKRISLPYRKETHFFSMNFDKKIQWYLDMFQSKKYDIRGEVDPSYIYYPGSLMNIKKLNKSPKFIIIFRNPLDRAYSHYLMSKKRNYEKLSFSQALLEEEKRILNDCNYFSFLNHSYMLRGNYYEQILRCKEIFPNSKYLFIKFDDLINKNRINILKDIYKFLNIDFNHKINFNAYKNITTSNKSELLSYLLYNDSKIINIIKKIIPSYYFRFKITEFVEKFNANKKLNITKENDYSSLDRKFIDWHNKQTSLLKKETDLFLDDWMINE